MKYIFTIVFIFCSLIAFSQNGRYYTTTNYAYKTKVEIIVFEDSNYIFKVIKEIDNSKIKANDQDWLKNDISFIYSYGSLKKNDNGFTLEDRNSKLKFNIEKKDGYYEIINSPSFALNRFQYDSNFNKVSKVKDEIKWIEKKDSILKKGFDKERNSKLKYRLIPDTYYDFGGNFLEIRENKEFVLKAYGIIISKGKYELKNNKLSFIDYNVKHVFSGFLWKEGIYVDNLPNCNFHSFTSDKIFSAKEKNAKQYYIDKAGVMWSLTLYENNKYSLDYFKDFSEDIVDEAVFSYGNYYSKGNTMILVDTNNGFKIELFKNDKSLLAKNPIVFWSNDTLRFIGDIYREDDKIDQRSNDFIYKVKKSFDSNLFNVFLVGQYSNKDQLSITFNTDSTYTLNNKYFCTSKGKWETIGNKIILFDSFLKHKFIGTILKEERIDISLPECYGKTIFYLKTK